MSDGKVFHMRSSTCILNPIVQSRFDVISDSTIKIRKMLVFGHEEH